MESSSLTFDEAFTFEVALRVSGGFLLCVSYHLLAQTECIHHVFPRIPQGDRLFPHFLVFFLPLCMYNKFTVVFGCLSGIQKAPTKEQIEPKAKISKTKKNGPLLSGGSRAV